MREITKYHDTSKTVKERAKNKLFGAVYSHTAIILLLILLQIGIMVLTFTYLGNYSTYMNGVMSLLSFITAIYIFNEKGNPAFKMTWICLLYTSDPSGSNHWKRTFHRPWKRRYHRRDCNPGR